MMGLTQFRHGEIAKEATRQAMTVNQAKHVNANADTFEIGTFSFTGNTVKGSKVAVAA
jgi:hypothetical protein